MQATREVHTAATMAFDLGADGEAAQGQVRRTWQQIAAAFWRGATASGEEAKPKPLYRTKVYEWLCATSHMLLVVTGRSWEAFAQPPRKFAHTKKTIFKKFMFVCLFCC